MGSQNKLSKFFFVLYVTDKFNITFFSVICSIKQVRKGNR